MIIVFYQFDNQILEVLIPHTLLLNKKCKIYTPPVVLLTIKSFIFRKYALRKIAFKLPLHAVSVEEKDTKIII